MKKNYWRKMLSVILVVIMVASTVCINSAAATTVDPYVKAAVDAGIFLEEVDPNTELDYGFFVPVLARCYKGNRGKEFTFEDAKEMLIVGFSGLQHSKDEKINRIDCALIVGSIWIYTGNEKKFTINSYELNCKDSGEIIEYKHPKLSALIQIGAFSLSPDGYFYPDKIATVGDLAQAVCVTMRLEVDLSGYQESASKEETKSNNLFSDVPEDHWAYDYIYECSSRGIINGYPDGTFKPEKQLKVGEFMKMVCSACFKYVEEHIESLDLPAGSHWARPYVIIGDGYFFEAADYVTNDSIERTITRLEATKMVLRLYTMLNVEDISRLNLILDTTDEYIKNIKDNDLLEDELDKNYINTAIKIGLINGFDDGTFRPYDGLTRAQAAKIIYLALAN